MVAWESSQNLGTPPLVSPQTDVWKWLQKFHTGDVVCHYPDLSSASDCNFPSAHDQSKALPRTGYWHLNSMKFLQSFLRRHFTGTPVVVSRNNSCFLRHTTNQKHYPELGIGTSTVWNFCSHFSDVISQGHQWWCREITAVFSGDLMVVQFSWCKVVMQLGVAMWVGTGLDVDPSSCSFPNDPFICWQVVMGRRDISLQNVVNCLREKQ